MNKEKLLEKIEKIKHNIAKHVLRAGIFAVSATAPAHTSGRAPEAPKSNFAPETSLNLSAENIFIAPEAVNIAPENHSKPIYEFTNKVYDRHNREVKDFVDVTKYSLWDCSYKREVGNEANPVGVAKTFYGSLQFNRFNAENMAIYGLLNPAYKEMASKFFVRKAGFNDAVAKFQESAKNYEKKFGDANLVYHIGSSARKALSQYISPKFKSLFQKEGTENTQQFLNLQRAYAGEVYCSFDAKNLDKIVSTLEKSHIKPEEINPAIWGMFLAKHIKGGFNGVAKLLEGKKLDEINNLAFIHAVASRYPDVFKEGSGKDAYKFAQEHFQERHSITTMKELSIILHNPDILNNYLQCLSFNQKGNITFEQAQELIQHRHDLATKITEKPSLAQISENNPDAFKIKLPKIRNNVSIKKLTLKQLIKARKSKSR